MEKLFAAKKQGAFVGLGVLILPGSQSVTDKGGEGHLRSAIIMRGEGRGDSSPREAEHRSIKWASPLHRDAKESSGARLAHSDKSGPGWGGGANSRA
jgi:hypothetical protein